MKSYTVCIELTAQRAITVTARDEQQAEEEALSRFAHLLQYKDFGTICDTRETIVYDIYKGDDER